MALDRFPGQLLHGLKMMNALPTHLTAYGDSDASVPCFGVIAFDATGRSVWQQKLNFRAHDVIAHPSTQRCAIIGRKPGPKSLIADLLTGKIYLDLMPLPNCTFDGHALFSKDGRYLFTTQSEGKAQRGLIVIYDLVSGESITSLSSYGTEPHELLWSLDGTSIIVGNGGIINRYAPDAIDSSLVWLDAKNGACLYKIKLEEVLDTLSLRHLVLLSDGCVVCGAQDQDPATDLRPLVLIAGRSGQVSYLDMPLDIHRRMAGYVGSVAVDTTRTFICATSPRGGLAVFWSVVDKNYVGCLDLPDTCGVAGGSAAGEFLLTSGHGKRWSILIDANKNILIKSQPMRADNFQWDNHLSRLPSLVV